MLTRSLALMTALILIIGCAAAEPAAVPEAVEAQVEMKTFPLLSFLLSVHLAGGIPAVLCGRRL